MWIASVVSAVRALTGYVTRIELESELRVPPETDWSALKPQSTGPRTYKGPEINAKSPWVCPSCGKDNTTRELSQGCEHCHAGEGAARFKGVDPIAKPKPKVVQTRAIPHLVSSASLDFARWVRQIDTRTWSEEHFDLLGAAFEAGWQARGMTFPVTPKEQTDADHMDRTDVVGGDLLRVPDPGGSLQGSPAPSDDQAGAEDPEIQGADGEGFIGTAQERTLLAALIFLREQVYSQQPEEVVSGEWLPTEQLDRWIAELKGPYA